MDEQIEEAICHLIETSEDKNAQIEIAKIEGYIYGLLDAIKKLKQ